jgi:hypothetical protein
MVLDSGATFRGRPLPLSLFPSVQPRLAAVSSKLLEYDTKVQKNPETTKHFLNFFYPFSVLFSLIV